MVTIAQSVERLVERIARTVELVADTRDADDHLLFADSLSGQGHLYGVHNISRYLPGSLQFSKITSVNTDERLILLGSSILGTHISHESSSGKALRRELILPGNVGSMITVLVEAVNL